MAEMARKSEFGDKLSFTYPALTDLSASHAVVERLGRVLAVQLLRASHRFCGHGSSLTTSDHSIPADAASMQSSRSDTVRDSNLKILCIGAI